MFRLFLFTICLTALSACVEIFNPKLKEESRKIVVEGLITDQPGPYRVIISYSAGYNNDDLNRKLSNAKVVINDDLGQSETLKEVGQGIYSTQYYQGKVGRTYTLTIETLDGRRYRSKPELMQAVAPITGATSEYVERLDPNGIRSGRFEVKVNTQDPTTKGNYYRWTWTHYNRLSVCITKKLPGEPPIFVESECCTPCWAIERCNGCILIGSDVLVNGNSISRKVAEVPYNSEKPHYLLLEQQSLSKEAYEFWQTIDTQTNNSGGVFDLPPATVPGNMECLTDPDEQVLGFFGASAVSQLVYYVNRSQVGKPPVASTPINAVRDFNCEPCKESLFRTGVRPVGWQE
jgi:hypothetical protein